MFSEWILTILMATPLLGALILAASKAPSDPEAAARKFSRGAMLWSVIGFALSIIMLSLFFQARNGEGQLFVRTGGCALEQDLTWVSDASASGHAQTGYLDFRYHVGVDGLSLWLLMLTAFITPLSIWASFSSIRQRAKEYYVLMLLLEAAMLGVFIARDLLLFYIFFEFTLIPLFFLIGIWGGPEKRRAAGKFFLYTFAGSMLTFAGVLFLAYEAYSLPTSQGGVGVFTFDLEKLYNLQLDPGTQWWLFLAFMAGFAIKVPLFPFHTWLPLAHTEAPTAGSVLLASVLLKLGTYGFLRFSLPMLPAASIHFAPLMAILAIIGVIYAALAAWVQGDVKKLVAYSSVSHLGFCILGMFSLKPAGLTGSLLYMVNHGLSTGALFLVIGMVYERYHTREFDKVGGLAARMPWMAFFLIVFTLSSIGLPGLNGFVSEFLVLLGTFTSNASLPGTRAGPLGAAYGSFAAIGIILSAIYMLYLCQRLLFGPLKEPPHTPDLSGGLQHDLNSREIAILTPIAVACLVIGVFPNLLIHSIQPAADRQVLARLFEGSENGALAMTLRGPGAPGSDLLVRESFLAPTHAGIPSRDDVRTHRAFQLDGQSSADQSRGKGFPLRKVQEGILAPAALAPGLLSGLGTQHSALPIPGGAR